MPHHIRLRRDVRHHNSLLLPATPLFHPHYRAGQNHRHDHHAPRKSRLFHG
ncbi:MAG: hypothetical protein J6386_08500 [Candidatus Synoicihabitans palmerolidicus]|nr:hypothetical protein [Candidatus Synoicihabitans palmerolidicus]